MVRACYQTAHQKVWMARVAYQGPSTARLSAPIVQALGGWKTERMMKPMQR